MPQQWCLSLTAPRFDSAVDMCVSVVVHTLSVTVSCLFLTSAASLSASSGDLWAVELCNRSGWLGQLLENSVTVSQGLGRWLVGTASL